MERNGIAFIVIVTVAILVGVALYSGSITQSVGDMTLTRGAVANVTYTLPAAGSSVQITTCGQKILTAILTNASNGLTVPASNYTFIQQASPTDGYLTAYIRSDGGIYAGLPVNVSCSSFEPHGYIADGGSRGIVSLIAIFFVLLIIAAALPDARQWFFGKIGGR